MVDIFKVFMTLLVLPLASGAQIIRVSPFLGTDQENWESLQVGPQTSYSSPTMSAFAGMAEFGSPHLSIYRTAESFYEPGGFGLGPYMAKTESGLLGLGKGAEMSPPVTISFTRPIETFGGYWAAISGQSHAIFFRFFDSNASLVGVDTFVYSEPNRDGTLEWAGWAFSRPVSKIEYTAWYVVNDSLRVITIVPEPNTLMILLLGSVICLFIRLKRRGKGRCGSEKVRETFFSS